MSEKSKKTFFVENFLSITGIIVSSVALFFAWRANQIALQQINSNVVALTSSYKWASYEQFNIESGFGYEFNCTQKLRLSNLGGAPASIVKWNAHLYYLDNTLELNGEQPYTLDPVNLNEEIRSFAIEFVDKYEDQSNDDNFPIHIPPYSTDDVYVTARVIIWRDVDFFNPPYDYYEFVENGVEYMGLDPIEVSMSFVTSSGQLVQESPRALCIYIKPSD